VSKEANEQIREEIFFEKDMDAYLLKLFGCEYTVSALMGTRSFFVSVFNIGQILGMANMHNEGKLLTFDDLFINKDNG